MENELNLDLDKIEESADSQLQTKNRFQKLANDNRSLAQEKEQAEAKAKEAEAKLALIEKQTEFYKTFNQVSSKYPEATNFQDKIKEKVEQGYDLEDATVSVLNREGKFNQTPAPVRTPSAEGGSSVTNVALGDKSVAELTTAEKFAQLQEMDKSGELMQALRRGINQGA